MMSTLPSAWEDLGGFDESALLASRLRQHQIGGGEKPAVMLQLTDLQRQGLGGGGEEGGDAGFSPLPLFTDRSPAQQSREDMDGGFKSPNNGTGQGGDHAMFNGFGAHGGAGAVQPPFGQGGSMSGQSLGGPAASGGTTAPASSGGAAPPRQTRVRARRGQATDPHSIAERLRRERIAERMKSLQELVPNANKTDKASMLDEIIDYVKFLQLQVKVLSMSRLGGAAGMAPLVASMSSEANSSSVKSSNGGGGSSSGAATAKPNGGGEGGGGGGGTGLRVTEQQVAKMMEEDMGTAMQYLQGKGLCLMPISLASAISSATTTGASPASLLSRPVMRHAATSVSPATAAAANGGVDDAAARTTVKVDVGGASGGK
uniref:Uncharacterized protein n=1 Tax=Avena sativa TaxID=4498 RepID=A0ACD6AD64_AVESA